MANDTFEHFKSVIRTLPPQSPYQPLPNCLKLAASGRLSIYYAPFDYVNPTARIVIVGITPGLVQAVNAINKARELLRHTDDSAMVLRGVKSVASFCGPMRQNLVRMLDYIKLNRKLGISSTADLFGSHQHLAHFTSMLRNPVFVGGKNYSGTPSMLQTSFLKDCLKRYFLADLKGLQDAYWVPLGPKVSEALTWVASQGHLPSDRILHGLPHPSGANAERIAYFLDEKPKKQLSAKTNPDAIDRNKDALLRLIG